MKQPNRAKTTDLNTASGKKLTSVNLPVETWAWVDEMAERNGLNRSALIGFILADFRDNQRTISITII